MKIKKYQGGKRVDRPFKFQPYTPKTPTTTVAQFVEKQLEQAEQRKQAEEAERQYKATAVQKEKEELQKKYGKNKRTNTLEAKNNNTNIFLPTDEQQALRFMQYEPYPGAAYEYTQDYKKNTPWIWRAIQSAKKMLPLMVAQHPDVYENTGIKRVGPEGQYYTGAYVPIKTKRDYQGNVVSAETPKWAKAVNTGITAAMLFDGALGGWKLLSPSSYAKADTAADMAYISHNLNKGIRRTNLPQETAYSQISKENVNQLFKEHPELSEVGTPELYGEYYNTIYPASKVKTPYAHGTNSNLSNGLASSTKQVNTGAPETLGSNDMYFNLQPEASLQYINGVNTPAGMWNKRYWSLKEILGKPYNNTKWQTEPIITLRQSIPNRAGNFSRVKNADGTFSGSGKLLEEYKAELGKSNMSDAEFLEELGVKPGETFNDWVARNKDAFSKIYKEGNYPSTGLYHAKIDAKNPATVNGGSTYYKERGIWDQMKSGENDVLLHNNAANEFNSDVLVVKDVNPEKVRILGSTPDKEGFAQFVGGRYQIQTPSTFKPGTLDVTTVPRPTKPITVAEKAGVPKDSPLRQNIDAATRKQVIEEANDFAEKYGYPKIADDEAALLNIQNMYRRHNTFTRSIHKNAVQSDPEFGLSPSWGNDIKFQNMSDFQRAQYAAENGYPYTNGVRWNPDRIFVTGNPEAATNYAGESGYIFNVRRPIKLGHDPKTWRKNAEFSLNEWHPEEMTPGEVMPAEKGATNNAWEILLGTGNLKASPYKGAQFTSGAFNTPVAGTQASLKNWLMGQKLNFSKNAETVTKPIQAIQKPLITIEGNIPEYIQEGMANFFEKDVIPRIIKKGIKPNIKTKLRIVEADTKNNYIDNLTLTPKEGEKMADGVYFQLTNDARINPEKLHNFGVSMHEGEHWLRRNLDGTMKASTEPDAVAYIRHMEGEPLAPEVMERLSQNHIAKPTFTPEEVKLLEEGYPWIKKNLPENKWLEEASGVNTQFRAQESNVGSIVGDELTKRIRELPDDELLGKLIRQRYTQGIVDDIIAETGLPGEDIVKAADILTMDRSKLAKWSQLKKIQDLLQKNRAAQIGVGALSAPLIIKGISSKKHGGKMKLKTYQQGGYIDGIKYSPSYNTEIEMPEIKGYQPQFSLDLPGGTSATEEQASTDTQPAPTVVKSMDLSKPENQTSESTAEVDHTTVAVSSTTGDRSYHYKKGEKERFKQDLYNAYTKVLKQRGMNPAFAKYLVAQDGLESGWGQSYAGRWNFGNITKGSTWKGSTTKGKDKDSHGNPIIQEFRNYDSIEDYANDKINLLNGKSYRAFSGTPEEFYERVGAGGYVGKDNPKHIKKYVDKLTEIVKTIGLNEQGGKIPFAKTYAKLGGKIPSVLLYSTKNPRN